MKKRRKAKANVELGRNFSRQTIVVKRRSEGRQTTSKTKSEKTKEEVCNHRRKIRVGQTTSKMKSEKTKEKLRVGQTMSEMKSEKRKEDI